MKITPEKQLGALWALWLLAGLIALWLMWTVMTPARPPVGQWAEATPSKVLITVPKETIQIKALKVYTKPAKAKLKLPEPIQQNDNQYVLASSTIAHSYRPQTVTTVVNSETGESTTITRREAYPWFAFQQTGEIRLDYGIKNGLERVGRLTLREDLIQIKGVNLGATAALDTDRAYFVGVGLGLKW